MKYYHITIFIGKCMSVQISIMTKKKALTLDGSDTSIDAISNLSARDILSLLTTALKYFF